MKDHAPYGTDALDRKHYIATAYLRYRLQSSPHCKAAQVDSMARLMRLADDAA